MSGKSRIDGAIAQPEEDYALVLAQERIVVEAQVAINRLLRHAGLKQSDLATLLGVSEARVSQMFSENARNLTLRTIARIFHVLGSRVRVVDDAELTSARAAAEAAAASTIGAADQNDVPVASLPTEADDAATDLGTPLVDCAPPLADAWLIEGRDIFEMLSEDAPFASQMVWVSNYKVVPANENHPMEDAPRRRGRADVRRWAAAQDRYAFG